MFTSLIFFKLNLYSIVLEKAEYVGNTRLFDVVLWLSKET